MDYTPRAYAAVTASVLAIGTVVLIGAIMLWGGHSLRDKRGDSPIQIDEALLAR